MAGRGRIRPERRDGAAQVHRGPVLLRFRGEEIEEELRQPVGPAGCGRLGRELGIDLDQLREQSRQGPENHRIAAFDAVEEQDGSAALRAPDLRPGERVAEEEPVEAEAPGVLATLGQAETCCRRFVGAPADVGLTDPALGDVDRAVVESDPAPERVALEQVEDAIDLETASRDLQQVEEGGNDRMLGRQAAIRDGEGKGGRCARGCVVACAEDRVDGRCVDLDVGCEHDDVPRSEGRIGLEHREQLVVQHLDLAHRPVADVDAHRVVVGADLEPVAVVGRTPGRALGTARDVHLEDVRLEAVQQRVPAG